MNMRHRWATSALGAVLVISKLSLREASASDRAVIGVVTPDTIGKGEKVTIRWNYDDGNGGSFGRFDIALYDCHGAFCGQFNCGDFVAEICDKPGVGCSDVSGDFPMTVPTNIPVGNGYKIRVGLHGSDLYDCSSTFSIVEEIPVPSLEVYIPTVVEGEWESDYVFDDDSASTVIESTVEILGGRERALQIFSGAESSSAAVTGTDTVRVSWKYDDGFGGTFARFNVDLYYCGGGCEYTQDCGEIVARLCDSCPDSAGNEAVTLPDPYSSYNYKIRVSTVDRVSRPVSACSPKFRILGRERPGFRTPSPASSAVATEPVPDPRASLSSPAGDLPATPVIRPAVFPAWGEEISPIEQPACDFSGDPPAVRYASSTGRIYVERNGTRGGCFTLSDIWEAGKILTTASMPLYRIERSTNRRVNYDTGVWLLTEDLYVKDGVTLQIHGKNHGGDCDELRLSSNGSTLINLRAHGASFSFLGTKVTSWDEGKGDVDYNYEDGRSYISAVSEVIHDESETCAGAAKDDMGEARMDVIESEIAYLGYHASESYGLVWKVRGFCVDKSNPDVFDYVDVYGDIINSNIHGNYFGMYSYGHHGGNWSFNKMHDNVAYGFDPHDDSDYLTIEGNDVWGNGNHGIIASKRCNHVRMLKNHVSWGHQAGLFLHRSTDHAIVRGNHVHDNGDAGLAFLESFYGEVTGNVFKNNKYGVRFSVGSSYNWVYNNVFANSRKYHLFTYLGSDPTDIPGTSGTPTGIVFWRNYLSGTRYQVMKIKESQELVVVNNRIGGASTMMFVDSTDVQYRDNEEEDGLLHIIRLGVCFTADSTLSPKC